ncbi:MAG: chromosome segregation protein ScpA [Dehalococcoidia bacterium]|nr:MAG: chromosome segregation protein ScpA [Dehalococcoidia bacterium]
MRGRHRPRRGPLTLVTSDQDAVAPVSSPSGEAPVAASSEGVGVEGDADSEPDFSLTLPAFQGPLDLLLHLIESSELDITEVSLLQVTDQYLQYLRSREQIDIGALADFIAIGARLLLLKSRALLPRDPDAVDDEEDDPAADIRGLVEALRDYRRFKQAAEFLRSRDGGHGTYRREVAPPKVVLPTGLDTVTLASLVETIRDVIARLPEEEPAGEVEREPVRLRDRITRLADVLDRDGRTSFRRLIEEATSRTMVIVDFMAVLELIKQRYLTAQQSAAFGDIELVRLTGATRDAVATDEASEDFTGA